MSSRQYLSGYQKRRLKEKRSDEIFKCMKLSNYFPMSTPTTETSHASTSEANHNAQSMGAF